MTLADIASIAGAVSAVAVLISLLFFNIQLHQEEKNQRALIQQGRAARTADIAMCLMASDFAEIHYRCTHGDADISTTQLVQFMGYCRAVFLGAEDSFFQHQQSLLDEMAFVSFAISLRAIFVAPGTRAIWSMTRQWYGPEFQEFMDRIVEETANSPHVDQLMQWKAAVSKEIGLKPAT